MASRVLLISVNTYTTPDPVFPLGMAHIAAALHKAGHEVFWQDQLAGPRSIDDVLDQTRPAVVGISIRNIDDVLIRKREVFFEGLPDLCKRIREHGCQTVVGGSGFSIFPEKLLEYSGADYGIRGEGETSFLSLLKALETGSSPLGIPGLVFRDRGKAVCNPRKASAGETSGVRIEPGWADYYVRNGGILNVQTQRGCAHTCCYCTYPLIEGRAHRRRSGEEVAEEFERLAKAGAKYVFIVDSIFNSSLSHVQHVCEAILKRNLNIPWGCFLRPQGLSAEIMVLMARAGLAHVEFGSDSLSDAVLHASTKGLGFEDIRKSSELARKQNIDYCHFLISGGPGETMATLEETFQRSQTLENAVFMSVVGMRIYPGTALFDRAVTEGVIRPETELLEPVYYLAPGLNSDQVFAALQGFAARSTNWIVGDITPAYARFVDRLRSRGIIGPLWGYLSMMQRLMLQGLATTGQAPTESTT